MNNFTAGTGIYRCFNKPGYVNLKEYNEKQPFQYSAPVVYFTGVYFDETFQLDANKDPVNDVEREKREPGLQLTFDKDGNCLEHPDYDLVEAVRRKER